MGYVVPIWSITSVPVVGSNDVFPVRRIYCVVRNYAAHAREMGFDPDREPQPSGLMDRQIDWQ